MKLTDKKLKQLVNEVLSEISTGATGLGGAKQRGWQSQAQKDAKAAEKEAQKKWKEKHGEQPDQTITQDVPDTTRWIHPWSNKTTSLSKGQAKPAKGWKITKTKKVQQAQKPLQQNKPLNQIQQNKPLNQVAQQAKPKPGNQLAQQAKPANQLAQQFKPANQVDQLAKPQAKPGNQVVQTQTTTTYGQGSQADYETARKSADADTTFSATRDTTNPTTSQTTTNPDWTEWNRQNQKAQADAAAAEAEVERQQQLDKEQEKPKDPRANGGVAVPKMGGMSSSGDGPGTGGKKGKGKKKKKNESINIGDKKMANLKELLSEVFDESPKVNKHKVIEGVSNYGSLGRKLYGENNLVKIAEALVEIAENAHHHILGEQGDWFDKVTVNKNMKALKGQVKEFKVVANEANAINQRLTSLYEDMGHILNRYYDINEEEIEEIDKHDPEELDNDFKDREDKDIDNDGDTDDSDEYLHKKRQAITKAMKETYQNMAKKPTKRLKDIKNVVSNPNSMGYFKNKK